MALISPNETANIAKNIAQTLKSKAFGGVSKESAEAGIELATKRTAELGNETIGKLQQEMQELKGKTAKEIADITSQKDAVILQTKKEAQTEINKVKEGANAAIQSAKKALKEAKASKIIEKILPNGNKLIRKANNNGAVMEKEIALLKNKNGEISEHMLNAKVTDLAGNVRKTKYNPLTGKPINTYTDTVKPRLYEYDSNGKNNTVKDVNIKKLKSTKPTLVTQTEPHEINAGPSGERAIGVDRIFSDGSSETIAKITNPNNPRVIVAKKDPSGQVYERATTWTENNSQRIERFEKDGTYIETEKFIDTNNQLFSRTIYSAKDQMSNRRICIGEKVMNSIGKKQIKRQKDEFGFYTDTYKGKYTFSKDSGKKPIKLEGTKEEIDKLVKDIENKSKV